jgi:tRNA threonylcarbamoyladenosine biosynthesis protein TsaB
LLILSVHTATASLGVAVVKDGQILVEKILQPGRQHLENLPDAIHQTLKVTNNKLRDFDGFGIAKGPGSFSGIRVGLSVIKGLALALNKKVIALSTLEILAWQAVNKGGLVVPLIDAGRGDIYTGVFEKLEKDIHVVQIPLLLNIEEIGNLLSVAGLRRSTLCGSMELLNIIGEENRFERKVIDHISPGAMGNLAEKRLQNGLFDDPQTLTPLYVRRSDAEERKERVVSNMSGNV